MLPSTESDEEALATIGKKMNSHFTSGRENIPVIGILTKSVLEEERPISDFKEIIEPKYFFLLQDAIVVPISLYSSLDEMKDALSKVNGLCLPGGHSNIWTNIGDSKQESDYTKAGRKLIQLALEINKAGTYFPVLGICLGFELMAACIGESLDIIEPCEYCNDYNTVLEYTGDSKDSKLLQAFSESQRARLRSAPLSFNYHSFKIDYDKFMKNAKLNEFFKVVSTSPSSNEEFSFVSTIEGRKYPFYAFQHHPEWCFHDFYFPRVTVVHTPETISIGKAIGDFFLAEARKNKNVYPNKEELKERMVMNGQRFLDSSKGFVYLFNHT